MACYGLAKEASTGQNRGQIPGPETIAKTRTDPMTCRTLQFASAVSFLVTMTGFAQMPTPQPSPPPTPEPQVKKEKKPHKENVEWMCQYGPPPAEARETDLGLDPRFRPFLAQHLTAPQSFWGNPRTGY